MNAQEIHFLEEIAANGHAALKTVQYDGWTLRFSNGYTGRANSISPLRPSTKEMAEKVAYCEKCYAEQGLPALFKLTDCDRELYDFLIHRGYQIVTPTDVMILDLQEGETAGSTENCIFDTEPSAWLPNYFAFEEISDPVKQDLFCRIRAASPADTTYCTLLQNGKPAACAGGAMEQGYMLLHYVVVSPELRGKGLGEKLCRGMIRKARELGNRYVYLQVVQTNTAALNLYRKLGFRKAYTYCYLKQPPEGTKN